MYMFNSGTEWILRTFVITKSLTYGKLNNYIYERNTYELKANRPIQEQFRYYRLRIPSQVVEAENRQSHKFYNLVSYGVNDQIR